MSRFSEGLADDAERPPRRSGRVRYPASVLQSYPVTPGGMTNRMTGNLAWMLPLQCKNRPLFTSIVAPVMNSATGLATRAIIWAMRRGVAKHCSSSVVSA